MLIIRSSYKPLVCNKIDGSFFLSILAIEELAKIDPGIAVFVDVQNTLVNNVFMRWATDNQKEKLGNVQDVSELLNIQMSLSRNLLNKKFRISLIKNLKNVLYTMIRIRHMFLLLLLLARA